MDNSEYNEYYQQYISLVENRSLVSNLKSGKENVTSFFKNLSEEKHLYRYAEGKWTPKEILLHLIDTERVFTYRALNFARSSNADLPGFDHDEFVDHSNANERTMQSLIAEYISVREANLSFVENCSEDVLKRTGHANDSMLSVRAAATIVCGHEIHHLNIIRERYF